ncbi:hypothetical protein PR202_gb01655 [Eleusine coracana subsp. coracana]|uniref:Gnk2-homologous domain-containing protein n=1 Tax=Eleusine coracana subsp. coracana TaxID=191504 RepID=A0AAV5DX72_ELECO|nr:hypothetical protein PR202_gb01655 [Eleusine coracana subsp. coracana]
MRSLLPILLVVPLSLLVTTRSGRDEPEPIYMDCPTNTSYTPGSSAFQANLDALLSSLPASAVASSGFATNVITGATPDEQAFGLAQCRADVNASTCRSCLDASVRDVATNCPGQKSAMFIYDACLLRYSNTSFFGVFDFRDDKSFLVYRCITRRQNATQSPQLEWWPLSSLLINLTAKAAYRSARRFAAGSVQATPSVTFYGMEQCTRDLADNDCNLCLSRFLPFMPYDCDRTQGVRMFHRSCSVRVEAYPFYSAQAVEAAMAPVVPAPPGGEPPVGSASRRQGNHFEAMGKVAPLTNAEDVSYFHIECVSDTNYTRGGAFQSNLESLLSSLPSAAASGGFAENATGAAPDQAYGLAQCRRDASAPDCSKCVDTLAQKLSSGCQGLKSAIAVASPCMLR